MFAMDRGGLKHISDETYMLFYSMEMELRRHLSTSSLLPEGTDIRHVITQHIISDDEVLFYWSTIAYNWDDEVSDVLLQMITDQWMKVRGFSHASAFMEKYKQIHQKSLEKSKGF